MAKKDEDKIGSETPEKKSFCRDTLDAIVVAFVVAMIIRTLFIQAFKIPSGSMLDTLQIGDHILVNKLAYVASEPKHDDIIVFECPLEPDKDYVKRIIGLPGDKIRIENKIVYRNDEKLTPAYTRFESLSNIPGSVMPRDNVAEFTVPDGLYFAMGDNRDSSFDGRFWGFISKKVIIGRAFVIYWSWGDGGFPNVRFDRILKLL